MRVFLALSPDDQGGFEKVSCHPQPHRTHIQKYLEAVHLGHAPAVRELFKGPQLGLSQPLQGI